MRLIAMAAAALAATTATGRAYAYCRTTTCPDCPHADGCPTGLPIEWQSSCVSYSMQYRASKQFDLVTATEVMEKAFAVWEEVSCGEGLGSPPIHVDQHFGNAACTLHEYNQTDANANIIIFRDDRWPYEGAGNVLGLTTVTYSRKSGAIFDVDMEINSTQHLSVEDPVPPTAYDLQSIVTHEAGHFLGLAHSTVASSTMVPQYTSGSQSFRMLDEDDIVGICAVYPPDAPAKCDVTPRQGFSPACGIFPSGNAGKCSLAGGGLGRSGNGGYGWLGLAGAFGVIGLACRRWRRDQAEGR